MRHEKLWDFFGVRRSRYSGRLGDSWWGILISGPSRVIRSYVEILSMVLVILRIVGVIDLPWQTCVLPMVISLLWRGAIDTIEKVVDDAYRKEQERYDAEMARKYQTHEKSNSTDQEWY